MEKCLQCIKQFPFLFGAGVLFVLSVFVEKLFSISLNGTWQGAVACVLIVTPLCCEGWRIAKRIKGSHPFVGLFIRCFVILMSIILVSVSIKTAVTLFQR